MASLITLTLGACSPLATINPTQTRIPILNFTNTPKAIISPTYIYIPTITLVPSSTPLALSPDSISPSLESSHAQANYDRKVTVTAKEEIFFLRDYYNPIYRVTLNFNNLSGKEITGLDYFLVTYKDKKAKGFGEIVEDQIYVIDFLGSNEKRNIIPVGESDVVVDVYIYLNENYSQCSDGSLEKPLYLLLFSNSIGSTDQPLTVSSGLNQKLLEIPCQWN